jgi:hypothetical protein
MKSLIVLSAMALSFSAFASDGTSSFRLDSGRILSFDYNADMAKGLVTGTVQQDGLQSFQLSNNRASGWAGNMGGAGIETAPIQTSDDGMKTLDVSTIQGQFHFIFESDAQGNLTIRTVGPHSGELLIAEMTEKGAFSLSTPDYSFELTRDSKNPTQFGGTVVTDYSEMDIDHAELDAAGTLDLNAVAKADPTLFVLLYVLPFEHNY